jgi:Zn-dependent oligopeptidase
LALPPFDALKAEHFRPAFDAAIAGQKAAITGSTEAPSLANTIVAVELSGLDGASDRTRTVRHLPTRPAG